MVQNQLNPALYPSQQLPQYHPSLEDLAAAQQQAMQLQAVAAAAAQHTHQPPSLQLPLNTNSTLTAPAPPAITTSTQDVLSACSTTSSTMANKDSLLSLNDANKTIPSLTSTTNSALASVSALLPVTYIESICRFIFCVFNR